MNNSNLERIVKELLIELGEDPNRDGLKETPKRVAKAYREVFQPKEKSPKDHLKLFESDSKEMVTVYDIPIYSFCEHHMFLFQGMAHVAYIPSGKVIGLSKLVRIVRYFSKGLQIQERLTKQIADFLEENLSPLGVAVCIDAKHSCMGLRGVRTPNSNTRTTSLKGVFLDPPVGRDPRAEFFNCVNHE